MIDVALCYTLPCIALVMYHPRHPGTQTLLYLIIFYIYWCLVVIGLLHIFHWEAKPFTLGPGIGLEPQSHNFTLGIPTCWYLKTRKFALSPTRNIKFVLPPTHNPNTSQWNIGCVGSPTQNFHFELISFALVTQRKPGLQWNMGL